jgi:hypothetical protein
MPQDDWCRRTTWTPADEAAFRARNRRSRGAHSKAQYLCIQAETLFKMNQPDLTEHALALAEECLHDFPEVMDRAKAFDLAGRCCVRLGYITRAVHHFHKALERQREFRGIQTLAAFNLGRLAVEESLQSEFDAVLHALDREGAAVFPWHAYMGNGIRAAIAHARGDQQSARDYARSALDAGTIDDTGLSHGRGALGTVRESERATRLHALLVALANG